MILSDLTRKLLQTKTVICLDYSVIYWKTLSLKFIFAIIFFLKIDCGALKANYEIKKS